MTEPMGEHREGACSRREFLLRAGLAGAAVVGAAALGFSLHDRKPRAKESEFRLKDFRVQIPADRPRIAAARGDNAGNMLADALRPFGGMGTFIEKGDVVVIKPNVGFASAPWVGATTNPEVMRAVIMAVLAAGAAKVVIAENSINDPQRSMQISGIAKVADDLGAEIAWPTERAFGEIEQPENAILKKWSFMLAPFRKATKVIGIPTAKHHSLAVASLGMKNWYGLLGGRRDQLHQNIHVSIADLATMVRPTLTVLDATRVLFRNGPTGGSPNDVREERTLCVGVDPVAVDTFGASLLDKQPEEVPYLIEAEKRGLGKTDLKAVGFEMLGGLRMGGFSA